MRKECTSNPGIKHLAAHDDRRPVRPAPVEASRVEVPAERFPSGEPDFWTVKGGDQQAQAKAAPFTVWRSTRLLRPAQTKTPARGRGFLGRLRDRSEVALDADAGDELI